MYIVSKLSDPRVKVGLRDTQSARLVCVCVFRNQTPHLVCVPFFLSLCYFCISGEGENELDRVVMAVDRQAAIQRQKEEAKKRRRKKKRTGSSLFASTFNGTI